ncbi:hypothetical protein B9T11_05490 [Wohlfahrtiimonas chitiniclastica]|uniref:XdhC family protein n=1 Tax=Wohlfahrtiimonas chitiniclastica TaxID=400946 RepID=UPI000B991793|nr:XdhC family protein [Wohlfahrtiimonas chitiniclastica]OYQ69524.1 hypothetical protein B9T13_08165 [Wohlfahrtiimonas chitiniclastica]OYQ80932.1 hypothetical protein B9T11_05490 [Wohlfahrtiimonas chitiniclastica]OYQ85688.1 hypothetical protein B9T14_04150 [Wohlfahrtiimonas chitiniclastica]OYQ86076.1 hypothetical protein B9T15_00880 [Wohlfahrtiimonas chitiniclastica]
MQMLDLNVLEDAINWLEQGKDVWLCTVVSTYGSAPRSPGALFAATQEGQYVGSLSGGCIEEDFLKRIHQQSFMAPSQVVSYGYGEGDFPPSVALPCGGTIEVLVEYLTPIAEHIAYLQSMHSALKGDWIAHKVVKIGEKARLNDNHDALETRVTLHDDFITITLQSFTTVFIGCISAVALYCIEFAHALGFHVLVCEDREEELRQLRSRPELMRKIELVETFPCTHLEKHGANPQTAILSLTHDPRIDDLTMMAALDTDAFYIGAMGSQRNSDNRMARLREVTDHSEATLARIHAPIGLKIGSKTPAEIALAILADIVRVKNGAA